LSLSYFLGFELTLGILAALVFASWTIVRHNRAHLAHANLQRLVALEHQAFQDEINIIRGDVADTADSAKRSIKSIGNAVLEAIRKVETRLNALQDRIEELGSRDDERTPNVEVSEIRRIRSTLERISKSQKLIEERLSDDIRFNLERAKVTDASLRGFANRMENFCQRLDALEREYDDLFASVGLLKHAEFLPNATPQTEHFTTSSDTQVIPTKTSQPHIHSADGAIEQSDVAGSAEPADSSAAYSNEEAA
jgi:hypothetical protein